MFDLAAILSPDWPELDFRRASSYVMERRNLEQARQLLQRCLRSQLTPEDPPREDAEALLKKVSGSYVRHPIQSTLAPEPSNFN